MKLVQYRCILRKRIRARIKSKAGIEVDGCSLIPMISIT